MNTRSDEIKQDNRKALPKFILILVAAGLLGGITGGICANIGMEQLADRLADAGRVFSEQAAPWLLVVCAAADLVLCLPMYYAAKAALARWDGEDEAAGAAVEQKISVAQWVNSILLVCGLFLAGAAYSAGVDGGDIVRFPLAVAAFVVLLFAVIFHQQKLVDLTKQLYPEKKGSVYEMRFQKKWLDSCDEAEKIIIGKCAYKAYTVTSVVCMVLWCVFTLTALFLGTGFLPVLAVCIILGVMQSVYCAWAIKLSKKGTSVL
jgi:hypothetical protein